MYVLERGAWCGRRWLWSLSETGIMC